ncbi:MAG: cobalamin-binding protein [Candidatus Latescibacterota bacterium]
MMSHTGRVIVALLISISALQCGEQRTPSSSPEIPKRIVSTAPNVTEILFVLGLGDRVVGVSEFCNYPEAARSVAKIGGFSNPSVEAIVALEPDLVVGSWGNPMEMVDHIRRLHIGWIGVKIQSVEEVFAAMEIIGERTGKSVQAKKLVAGYRSRIRKITEYTELLTPEQRPRIFWGGWHEPIYTAGPGSYINDLIEMGGGRNVAENASGPWPRYGMEAIVAADPEVFLCGHDPEGYATDAEALEALRARSGWRDITAVRTGRVHLMRSDAFLRPGPRLVDALEQMVETIHPNLVKEEDGRIPHHPKEAP